MSVLRYCSVGPERKPRCTTFQRHQTPVYFAPSRQMAGSFAVGNSSSLKRVTASRPAKVSWSALDYPHSSFWRASVGGAAHLAVLSGPHSAHGDDPH